MQLCYFVVNLAHVSGQYEVQVRWPTGDLGSAEFLSNRNSENPNWASQVIWSPWQSIYLGPGRVFNWETRDVVEGHPYQFRVRAVGRRQPTDQGWDVFRYYVSYRILLKESKTSS